MNMNMKSLFIVAGLCMASGSASATVIDFKALANAGERGYSPSLMFDEDGVITSIAADTFLTITATNGGVASPYLDAGNAGLGVCGELNTSLQCDPSNDDNVSYRDGAAETLYFTFAADVIIDSIWLNNNHDGDRSLLDDYVQIGDFSITNPPTQLTNGGSYQDSKLELDLLLNAGSSFSVGFAPTCGRETSNGISYDNCEFYVSKIEFSTVPEPTILALLGLGLFGMGATRRRLK